VTTTNSLTRRGQNGGIIVVMATLVGPLGTGLT